MQRLRKLFASIGAAFRRPSAPAPVLDVERTQQQLSETARRRQLVDEVLQPARAVESACAFGPPHTVRRLLLDEAIDEVRDWDSFVEWRESARSMRGRGWV